ncbi:MAG: hypothetical protein RLZZ28_1054 [Bacteroidota bacterium]
MTKFIVVLSLALTIANFIFLSYQYKRDLNPHLNNFKDSNLVKLGGGDASDMPTPKSFFVVNNVNTEGANLLSAFRINQSVATQSVQPLEGYAKLNHLKDTTKLGFGLIGNVEMNSPAFVNEVRSVQGGGVIKSSGRIKNWTSFYATLGVNGGSGNIKDAYGFFMSPWPNNGITIKNKWGVYIADSTAKNYFAGDLIAKHLSGNTGDLNSISYLSNSKTTVSGNDLAGEIILNTMPNVIISGRLLNITFSSAYTNAPKIILTCSNENAPTLISNLYVTATNESFTLNFISNTPKSLSGIYKWNYIVIQ